MKYLKEALNQSTEPLSESEQWQRVLEGWDIESIQSARRNPLQEYPGRVELSRPELSFTGNDLVFTTLDDLSKNVTPDPSSPIRVWLDAEMIKAQESNYGVSATYPTINRSYRLPSAAAWKLSLLASNGQLIRDQEDDLSWLDMRNIFNDAHIAVAGASVGSRIAHSIRQTIMPGKISIADPKGPISRNFNRTDLTVHDIQESKAIGFARHCHDQDPFALIDVYPDGFTTGNIDNLFVGRPDIFIEETDTVAQSTLLAGKIEMRKKARQNRVPFIMISDLGTLCIVDCMRYDLAPNHPLAINVRDDEVEDALRSGDFYKVASMLVGQDNLHAGVFGKELRGETTSPYTLQSPPQIGIATNGGAALAGSLVASILLGDEMPFSFRLKQDFNSHALMTKQLQ